MVIKRYLGKCSNDCQWLHGMREYSGLFANSWALRCAALKVKGQVQHGERLRQEEAVDTLLVQILRALQAITSLFAATDLGPAIWSEVQPAESGAGIRGRGIACGGIGSDYYKDPIRGEAGLAVLGDCLAAEARNTYQRIVGSSHKQSSAPIFCAFGRLRGLARQLAKVDPFWMQRARKEIQHDAAPWFSSAFVAAACSASPHPDKQCEEAVDLERLRRGKLWTDPVVWLCRFVLSVEYSQPDSAPISGSCTHDLALVVSLRSLVLCMSSVVAAAKSNKSERARVAENAELLCLLWWAAAGLSAEVRMDGFGCCQNFTAGCLICSGLALVDSLCCGPVTLINPLVVLRNCAKQPQALILCVNVLDPWTAHSVPPQLPHLPSTKNPPPARTSLLARCITRSQASFAFPPWI